MKLLTNSGNHMKIQTPCFFKKIGDKYDEYKEYCKVIVRAIAIIQGNIKVLHKAYPIQSIVINN